MGVDGVVNRVVQLADCREHPGNYQKHGEAQIKDLARSLKKFGQVRSIVVQDDAAGGYVLVAGHGLTTAAKAVGLTELRADVIPPDWPEIKVLAYLAADNELARAADPDQAQLAALVAQVNAADAELAALAAGTSGRLKELLQLINAGNNGEAPEPQIDKAAELQEKWQTELGQLWGFKPYTICPQCGKRHELSATP